MMKLTKLLLVLALTALLPVMAQAQTPGSGIAGTAHDFYAGTFVQDTTIGECTFCHTPHKAVSTLLLWNHSLSTNATFQWDVTASTAGTTFPTITNSYNGPTAKCLSCHDGSVAIGDIAWFQEASHTGAAAWNTTQITDPTYIIGGGGDMSGNHPVAMPYPYQNAANTYNTSTTGSGAVLTEWQADPTTLNIRLFNDNDGTGTNISAGPVALKTGIECSSCHDPHNKAATEDMFLRGSLTGNDTNYLCLKCHIK